jgi:hypothetical protein
MYKRTDGRTSHRAAALLRSAVLIAGRALLLTVALMFTGAVTPREPPLGSLAGKRRSTP